MPTINRVIESASGGMPGWIQNFVISLVQRGALTIVTLPRSEAQKKPGVVMPAQTLITKAKPSIDFEKEDEKKGRQSFQVLYVYLFNIIIIYLN